MIINHKEISANRKRKPCEKCHVTKLISSFGADSVICTRCERGHVYPDGYYDPADWKDNKMWLG